ncbi:MAG TPA: hypothetical protein VJN90_02370 [Candidatus Acidoferrales bacterium]|nr:hypothetical protein [Candidatus Acidoferrales bacterium]
MKRAPEEVKKALIVVRTYPTPAVKGVEVSCTAAISEKQEWLRLHPIRYRYLPRKQRFQKYQWVELTVTKTNDGRPESYTPKNETIKIVSAPLSTENGWQARKEVLFPLRAHCMCCLKKDRDANGYPTLGLFRPKIIESLLIKASSPHWTQAQLAILRQEHLFEKKPTTELERIPFNFRYAFRCDHDTCTGHKMFCSDWEMGEAFRKWRAKYGDGWEAKFRQRFETEMIQKYDTHFYVGTVAKYPDTWIIVGLFYPPCPTPLLFDSVSQPAP